jgi:transcription antitermination factor NusG
MSHTASSERNKQLHETELRWFAIRTRFKCEKFVQRILDKRKIRSYIPLRTSIKQYGNRTRRTELPLIPCYVFVQICQKDYLPILETEHVLGFVRTARELTAIPEHEIQTLRRVTLEDSLEIDLGTDSFLPGQPVEIAAGNLIGLRGHVVQQENKQQLQIELNTLGYTLLITLDAQLLTKLKSTP